VNELDNSTLFTKTHAGSRAVSVSAAAAQEAYAQLLNIPQPEQIGFIANIHSALATAIETFPWQAGEGIVISATEPHSVLRAVREMAREQGIQYYIVPYADGVPFDLNTLEALLQQYPDIRIVATQHASKVTGSLLPVKDIGRLTHQYHKRFWLDISQTVGRFSVDAQQCFIDLLTWKGNQTCPFPPNIVGVYSQPILPILAEKESIPASTLKLITEALTPILKTGIDSVRTHETVLITRLLDGLLAIPEVSVYGHTDIARKIPIVSFNILNHHPQTLADQLLGLGHHLKAEAGFHGSLLTHEALGTVHRGGTVRVELCYQTRPETIDALLDTLKAIIYSTPERTTAINPRFR
jgi:cysteine desulfurase / selenocysteine lyase